MKRILLIILLIIIPCLMFMVHFALADYKIEVALPGGPAAETTVSLIDYIRYVYLFGLGLVGVAALGALVYGGFTYMLSGTITKKEEAIKYIWGAISGLVLGLAAFLILNTINPDLVSLKEPDKSKIEAQTKKEGEPISYSCAYYCPNPEQEFEGTRDSCTECYVAGLSACEAACNEECTISQLCTVNY